MKSVLLFFLLACGSLLSGRFLQKPSADPVSRKVAFLPASRPNILYIMSDDMGYGDLSCYGGKDFKTPHLDKLAAQGIKFLQAYAAAPLCTPTRAALLTGRYPARTPVGLMEPITPTKRDSAYGLTPDYPTLAGLLGKSGYQTALIGKWHLGFLPQHSPTKNGFDYFFGFRSGAADYISHKGGSHRYDLFENDSLVYAKGYLTDLLTERTVAYLKQPHDKPFFLALHFNAPHWPWQGPQDAAYPDTTHFTSGGSRATYQKMMISLDNGVGAILQALEEAQLSNQTLVIFTNDNGGERYSDHGGLSGAKASLWEGGIRVPALVRWPGRIKPGTTTHQVAVTMDWTASMLAVAGARPHPDFPLDGIDLMPLMQGKQKIVERSLYWRTVQRDKQHYALRQGDWKYLKNENGEYLFNLARDPGEKQDQKQEHAALFAQLRQKYQFWEKTVLEPIPY